MNSILQKKKNITSIKKKYIISTSNIEKKINKKLLNLQKTIVINGFRKGKVPKKIIENQYRNNIFNEILKKIIHKNFIKLIQKKNIQNYKNIQYFFGKYIPGTDFNYTIKFDSISDKLIQKLKSISLYNLDIHISEENINQIMLNFQKNISNWVTKNTVIKKNDKVNIYYQCKLTNHNKNILENKNFSIIIDKNLLLKKIFNSIIGKKIGDEISFNFDFSKYHPEKKIAGKKTNILIKIINVQEKKNQKISFKKFKKFGFLEKNIKELRKNIYIQIQEESKKTTREYLKKQFIKQWIKIKKIKKNNKIQLKIKKYICKYQENFLSQYKKNKNIFEKLYNKNINKASKKKIIIDILIKKIIDTQSLSLSHKLIKKVFKNTAKNFIKKNNKYNIINKKIIIQNIKNFLLKEKAFNFIFKHTKIKNKKVDFKKALKKNKNTYL